jgi:hypothetical protein
MNQNEQMQANRSEEMSQEARTERKMEGTNVHGEQELSTRDLARGGAVKAAPARDGAQRDRDKTNGRETLPGEHDSTPLFETGEAESLRSRWTAIQTQFVDEPRRSVEQADELVASAMKRLAQIFADEREGLEQNWDRGQDVSTEDLRIALQRYRSFFDRLLSV